MDKIKSLLLPLAIVFGAIAVFEFGARYGATNMRAYAIASGIQFPLQVYAQSQNIMGPEARGQFEFVIDSGLAAGSIHREIWHLNKQAKESLDKVLAYGFSIRGDEVAKRFESQQDTVEGVPTLPEHKLAEIRAAVTRAKVELVDNAPSVEEKEEAQAESSEEE